MSSNPERLQYLLRRYLQDTGTPMEIREFWNLVSKLDNDAPLKNDLWQFWDSSDSHAFQQDKDWDEVLQRIRQQAKAWEYDQPPGRIKRAIWTKVAVASALLLLLMGGGYWLFKNHTHTPTRVATHEELLKNDIAPGQNRAVLTLGNGAQIILDSARVGQLAQQGITNIVKVNGGQVVYKAQNRSQSAAPQSRMVFNTLSTPRGGQYKIRLPDGTKAWLDAASSITYPVAFNGSQRKVKISGQVYFEVAKNAAWPFIVTVSDRAEVRVLGTHFNISAYPGEKLLKTTVLEGKISIHSFGKDTANVILLPGNQAVVDKLGKLTKRTHVNMESIIAWKNNYFVFNNSSLEDVMRQLSRWYDTEVEYKGAKDVFLNGRFKRNNNLSVALKILQTAANVKFMIVGRKIIVDYKKAR